MPLIFQNFLDHLPISNFFFLNLQFTNYNPKLQKIPD